MVEKRKGRQVTLHVYLNKYVAGLPYTAQASNISCDGLSLTFLLEPDMTGKRVGLQFHLPGSAELISAEGEVVREGVRFTVLADHHRKLIERFCEGAGLPDN